MFRSFIVLDDLFCEARCCLVVVSWRKSYIGCTIIGKRNNKPTTSGLETKDNVGIIIVGPTITKPRLRADLKEIHRSLIVGVHYNRARIPNLDAVIVSSTIRGIDLFKTVASDSLLLGPFFVRMSH